MENAIENLLELISEKIVEELNKDDCLYDIENVVFDITNEIRIRTYNKFYISKKIFEEKTKD